MVTLVRCSLRKRPTASASSQDTNPSLLLRAQSGIAEKANKVRKTAPRYLKRSWKRCGTDHLPVSTASTYVETKMNYYTGGG